MMFSKLSFFIAATMVAFVTAAGPLPQGGSKTDDVKTPSCPSGPVECCTNTHKATADDVNLAHEKLGIVISPGSDVWVGCNTFGNTCPGPTVCCNKVASDGSIAVGCTGAKA